MRKLLLIATLSVTTFAFAQASSDVAGMQPTNDDFYNNKIAQQVDQYERQCIAIGACAQFAGQNEFRPPSMASNQGENWYEQKLAQQVNQFKLDFAVLAPSAEQQARLEVQTEEQPASMAANEGSQADDEDFYNQRLAQVTNQSNLEWAAIASSSSLTGLGQSQSLPASMASNIGLQDANNGSYEQRLANAVRQYDRDWVAITSFRNLSAPSAF